MKNTASSELNKGSTGASNQRNSKKSTSVKSIVAAAALATGAAMAQAPRTEAPKQSPLPGMEMEYQGPALTAKEQEMRNKQAFSSAIASSSKTSVKFSDGTVLQGGLVIGSQGPVLEAQIGKEVFEGAAIVAKVGA